MPPTASKLPTPLLPPPLATNQDLIGQHAIRVRGPETERAHEGTDVSIRITGNRDRGRIGLALDDEHIPGDNIRRPPHTEVLANSIPKEQFHIVFGKLGRDRGRERKRRRPARVIKYLQLIGPELGPITINSENGLREPTRGFRPCNLHVCGIRYPVSREKLQVIRISTEGCAIGVGDGRVGPSENVLCVCC